MGHVECLLVTGQSLDPGTPRRNGLELRAQTPWWTPNLRGAFSASGHRVLAAHGLSVESFAYERLGGASVVHRHFLEWQKTVVFDAPSPIAVAQRLIYSRPPM